jgi:hypothetical protein
MAPGWAAQIGITLEEFNEAKEKEGLTSLALKLCEVDLKNAMSNEDKGGCYQSANPGLEPVANQFSHSRPVSL